MPINTLSLPAPEGGVTPEHRRARRANARAIARMSAASACATLAHATEMLGQQSLSRVCSYPVWYDGVMTTDPCSCSASLQP
jgi:hypothetical protein